MALNINGRMKVKTLRADFKKEFGLTLRVYDGRSFADDDSTLAAIRKGDSKGGEFGPRKNTKVGNLEDKIMEMFGIKTQVAGSDDSYLCDNDLTLAGALEADQKKMKKREKKYENNESNTTREDNSVMGGRSIMVDLIGFQEDKGVEDYYKSDFNILAESGVLECFVDDLNDAIKWDEMEKGELKELGSVTVYCVDKIIHKVDDPDDYHDFKGEKLIKLVYEEYPDDTIKLRYEFDGCIEDGNLEHDDTQALYYIDHEGQYNPLDYSCFQNLYNAIKKIL